MEFQPKHWPLRANFLRVHRFVTNVVEYSQLVPRMRLPGAELCPAQNVIWSWTHYPANSPNGFQHRSTIAVK